MKVSPNPTARHEARMRILELIERRREAECDSGIGASIERQILAEECKSLEGSGPTEGLAALSENVSE